MKAYKLTARFPDICKVEEVEVLKLTTMRVYDNGMEMPYRTERTVQLPLPFQSLTNAKGGTESDYFEYFKTKKEAVEVAIEFAERFLLISKQNLAAAENNWQNLLDEQHPSLFDVINEQ